MVIMNAILICYNLKKISQTERTALNRELNGYKDFSNKSQYTYKRKGILDRIPHIKPHDSVIIAKKQYKNKLLRILRKFNAKIKHYDIQLKHPKLA